MICASSYLLSQINQGVMFAQVLKYVYILCILQIKNMFRPLPPPFPKIKKKLISCSGAVIITVPEVAKSHYFCLKASNHKTKASNDLLQKSSPLTSDI